MAALPVKAPYGPTLPALLAPRLRAARPAVRALALAATVALLALVALLLLRNDPFISRGGAGPHFSFYHAPALRELRAPAGEYALLEDRSTSGVMIASEEVGPLRLPPSSGEVSGVLPLVATNYIHRLAATVPAFVLQSEGRTQLNSVPAYFLTYSRALAGRLYYGRVTFITPGRTVLTGGVTISMLTLPSAVPPPVGVTLTPDLVGIYGVLSESLNSFHISA